MREADLPAEHSEAQEEARFSRPDADPRWSKRAQEPPAARPRPFVGLTRPVRGHETFRDLARSPVRRHGALSVRFVGPDDSTLCGPDVGSPRVSYAIGGKVGSAPTRNRIRRRLRAIVADHDHLLVPGGAYLIGVGPPAVKLSFAQLREALIPLLERARSSR